MKKILIAVVSLLLIAGLAFAVQPSSQPGQQTKTLVQESAELSKPAMDFAKSVLTKEILDCANDASCEYNELSMGFVSAVISVLIQVESDSVVVTELIRESKKLNKELKGEPKKEK